MSISAVIFDLDGTVLDNEDEYGTAFRKVLSKLGKKTTAKYPHIQGIGVKENWPHLLAKYKVKTKKSLEELTKETQDEYLLQLNKVTLKKGIEKFVRDLKKSNITTALATSNVWWIVDEIFSEFKLDKFFDVTTSGEEVEYKKPDPDLYLLTADKLGVSPEECLVIKDSQSGIEAAHRAGMLVIGIARDAKHAKTLKDADIVVFNYYQLTPQILAQTLAKKLTAN